MTIGSYACYRVLVHRPAYKIFSTMFGMQNTITFINIYYNTNITTLTSRLVHLTSQVTTRHRIKDSYISHNSTNVASRF